MASKKPELSLKLPGVFYGSASGGAAIVLLFVGYLLALILFTGAAVGVFQTQKLASAIEFVQNLLPTSKEKADFKL